ncbi:MAG: molybdenum cofactor biosysynthesis protein, partial [Bacteroidetes bacterium]|nr:molybdenum cofactor biosysynthesis protein [Bacteroidota bacterium]
AKASIENGIGDDYRGAKKDDRQVSIMSIESWNEVCAELDRKLHWTKREANILVEGIDLVDSVGDILKIGDFYIEITGELKPGNKMDKVFVGLKKALTPNWRGGVTGKVLNNGMIHEGDKVTLMERA